MALMGWANGCGGLWFRESGCPEKRGWLMRMTAASLQGLGPLAPVARMRTLIQLSLEAIHDWVQEGGSMGVWLQDRELGDGPDLEFVEERDCEGDVAVRGAVNHASMG